MDEELALQGLFLHLVREGFRLSIRDYQDALKSLRTGYGQGNRDNLLWLCQKLWARSDDEERVLSLLFRRFPSPTPKEITELTGQPAKNAGPGETGVDLDGEISRGDENERRREETEPLPGLQIAGRTQPGIGLPGALVEPVRDETFILTPKPVIPLRALIVAWRRFRASMRTGPKVELDLEATINEQCRRGILREPVLVPLRRNQAKVVVLIDVSNSMMPWQDFNNILIDSLRRSQLGQHTVYYFNNAPEGLLYERETLTGPSTIADALKKHPGSTALIISDGGAARGFTSRDRVEQTREFISKVCHLWQPIVWMNPMPQSRWRGSSATKIRGLSNIVMFELNEERLIHAVDVLRGQRHK